MDNCTEQPAAGATRAPRLTENRLADLDQVVQLLDDSIEELEGSIAYWSKSTPRTASVERLQQDMQNRLEAYRRGRAWISGKVAAEREHRAEAVAS